MTRRFGRAVGLLMVGGCAALLLSSTLVSGAAASSFRVTFAPSYRSAGGAPLMANGSVTNVVHYLGGNSFPRAPSVNDTFGAPGVSLYSFNQQGGASGQQFLIGIQNLNFTCNSSCAASTRTVVALWNVSWAASVRSNCTSYYAHGLWAWVSVKLQGEVYDVTNGTPVPVSGHTVLAFHRDIPGKSPMSGNASKGYPLRWSASLAAGHMYEIVTYVLLYTFAHSLSGCGSYSSATVYPYVPITHASGSQLKVVRVV